MISSTLDWLLQGFNHVWLWVGAGFYWGGWGSKVFVLGFFIFRIMPKAVKDVVTRDLWIQGIPLKPLGTLSLYLSLDTMTQEEGWSRWERPPHGFLSFWVDFSFAAHCRRQGWGEVSAAAGWTILRGWADEARAGGDCRPIGWGGLLDMMLHLIHWTNC